MPYLPHTKRDIAQMLDAIGVASIDDLIRVPPAVALRTRPDVVDALAESEIMRRFESFAARNEAAKMTSFLGAGAYRHYCPPAIMSLAMRGEFLTSYTPYQAEVSQGYLQAIYEWQTYICLLTGLDIADASVYDGATALAEGAIMALGATARNKILVSRAIHPNYRAVLKTYCDGLDVAIDEVPILADGTTDMGALREALSSGSYAAAAVQSPNFFGTIESVPDDVRTAFTKSDTIPIAVVAEALSLAALQTPASWGAQICVGEAQSFGVSVAYGGPYVGFIACKSEHLRRIPGRLVGRTVDRDGKTAYVLTLQAREQHIRRERATSNICTNQAHCALIATIYLALMGESGLRDCAAQNVQRAHELATRVSAIEPCRPQFDAPFFNEFAINVGMPAGEVLAALQSRGILGGLELGRFYPELRDCILMTVTEMTSSEDIDALCAALKEVVRVPATL